ncbi:hypothetical protein CFC21_080342 [Triticum aestivum]|uniref:Knottin scorpion toxin-like domain-containing protein n=3 Tax=Triticinae TaxID=1648030 RepID=A0A453M7B8_AEGTS|nr:hypothetical protein CFC21_080342 [Triticum aestivum]
MRATQVLLLFLVLFVLSPDLAKAKLHCTDFIIVNQCDVDEITCQHYCYSQFNGTGKCIPHKGCQCHFCYATPPKPSPASSS